MQASQTKYVLFLQFALGHTPTVMEAQDKEVNMGMGGGDKATGRSCRSRQTEQKKYRSLERIFKKGKYRDPRLSNAKCTQRYVYILH